MTTVYEWPRLHRGAIQSRFYLRSGNVSSMSLFSGEVSPYGPTEQRWYCDISFPQKRGPEHRELSGFIDRLRGISGLVRMVDYYRMYTGKDTELRKANGLTEESWSDDTDFTDGTGWQTGYLPPSVSILGPATKGATSFVLTGLPASTERVLRMGDLIEVRPNGIAVPHGHLYDVISDARTNADGETGISFEPPLRKSVAMGDQVVLRYPSSVFRLAKDDEGIMTRQLGNIGSMGLSLVEVLAR